MGTGRALQNAREGLDQGIREALGITTAQLATRLRVKQPSIVAIEQSEAKGAIQLATLRRVAEALDCTLVYALVPNKPLETTLRDRAMLFARRRRGPVEHSMLLEDQKVTDKGRGEASERDHPGDQSAALLGLAP